jgi:glutamate--cysteine ligase
MFLALCLMKDSPPIDVAEQDVLDANHVTVARRGREPGLTLQREGRAVALLGWARELIDSMAGIAEVFDRGDPAKPFAAALAVQAAKIENVALTPSARMLAELESTGESFFDLSLRMSRLHKEYFLALYPPNVERQAEFRAEADESLRAQAAVEAADRLDFEDFLAQYLSG